MITSLSNERIKHIRRLKDRKGRQEAGRYFVEGVRLVVEACQQGAPVEWIVYAPELLTSEIGWKLIHDKTGQIELIEVSPEVFESFSSKDGPQGLAAVLKQTKEPLSSLSINDGLWVVLDAVADPGNLGTIIRTLEAAGGRGVILTGQTTDPFDPAVIRATMGAFFDIEIYQSSFEEFKTWKAAQSVMLVGTDGEAKLDYRQVTYHNPTLVFMGSERVGLTEEHESICDAMVKIPMQGKSDSLNLAVATGLMIYQVFNQWNPVNGVKG